MRPRWELALALYAALGIAGSVVAVAEPAVGAGLALLAFTVLALDTRGWFLLRWLTPSRATQNVLAASTAPQQRTQVILTAHCDTPRGGLPRSRWLRRLGAMRPVGWLGPLGWLALALVAVAACAATREAGASGAVLGAAQLVPTLVLIAALGVLIDGALARPVAGDATARGDATAATTVVELTGALDAAPPRHLAVDVVIGGAGSAQALGFLAYLRDRRPPRASTVVIEVTACRAGPPAWWTADGSLLPLRYHPRLAALAAGVAADERHLGAAPHRGRDLGAALRARQRRLPALRIGCPASDAAERVDPAAATAVVELGLALVHALDDELAG